MATKPPSFEERIAIMQQVEKDLARAWTTVQDEVKRMEASNKRFTEQRAQRATQKASH